MAKKKKIEENASLLNIISPIAMKFEANQFILGENYCKGYGAIKYPPNPDYGLSLIHICQIQIRQLCMLQTYQNIL